MTKLKAAIIGSGKIGTDLLLKILKTDFMKPVVFIGRRIDSEGIQIALGKNIPISTEGISYLQKNPQNCDIVFDCSNAASAKEHAVTLKQLGIKVIDLTPAKVGEMCIPCINGDLLSKTHNVNMITCGGQSSIPMFQLIAAHSQNLQYLEMVSIVASEGVGMATRENVDEYIQTTEHAIAHFTGVPDTKVMLNVNPAKPCINMQTTLFAKAKSFSLQALQQAIDSRMQKMRQYLPYYELTIPPTLKKGALMMNIKIRGAGDYLPKYAGNLDIINCSAIEISKNYYNSLSNK